MRDCYGRILTEEIIIPPEYNAEGEEIKAEQIKIQPIINSEYDPSIPYIPRSKRSEWAPIGLLGQLIVQDDGTCWAGGYCKNGDNGLATLSLTRGWRVMERIDENHIKILFK